MHIEDIVSSESLHWFVFALGVVNLLAGTTLFASCRFLGHSRLGQALMRYPAYQTFYRHHSLLWVVFWGSVLVHMAIGTLHAGLPWMH